MSSDILAIDPGTGQSAWLTYDGKKPTDFGILPNEELLEGIRRGDFGAENLAIEGVASYGKPVGAEVFTTCIWIGRFAEASGACYCDWELVYRPEVKLHLCYSRAAKDPMVRQALIDKFGPGKQKAIGLKKSPGPLYGISSHSWSALAIAVTWWESHRVSTPAAPAATT